MNNFDKRNAGFSGLAGLFNQEPPRPDPFGLNPILDALKQDSVRTRSSWNDRFSHWETAESTTETKAIERARDMVHGVLRENKWLASEGVTLGPQGSFTNRTNVRNEADIDLRVQHPSLRIECDSNVNFQAAYQAGTYVDTGRSFAELACDMRNEISRDLKACFGKGAVDDTGKKAIRVDGVAGSRGEVDVVPCFTLHHIRAGSGFAPFKTVHGIAILSTDGHWTLNYPEQHIANGRLKRATTGHQFKRMVRIIKRLQTDMEEHGVLEERVPSFLIECLVYLVEDHHFVYNEDRYGRVKRILSRVSEILSQGGFLSQYMLLEINGVKPLFGGGQAWTLEKAQRFVNSALRHLGNR